MKKSTRSAHRRISVFLASAIQLTWSCDPYHLDALFLVTDVESGTSGAVLLAQVDRVIADVLQPYGLTYEQGDNGSLWSACEQGPCLNVSTWLASPHKVKVYVSEYRAEQTDEAIAIKHDIAEALSQAFPSSELEDWG